MNFRLIAFYLVVLASSRLIEANTVNYNSLPDETLPNGFDFGGITVTSPGILTVGSPNFGLSVVGSINGAFIEGTESASFTFDTGAAAGVIVTPDQVGVGSDESDDNFKLTGFGVGGASLGTLEVNFFATFPTYDISSLFGNATLSGFTVAGDGPNDGGISVATITFSPVSSSAPEPATLVPTCLGLIALTCVTFRRR
jgi:hypothetical protein